VLLLVVLGVSGCGLMQSAQSVTRQSMKSLKPRPTDYRDTTSETDDEWTNVGRTANTVRGVEKDDDPLRKMLLSPKALSIERNLGIE
jgi:hypothetical protein